MARAKDQAKWRTNQRLGLTSVRVVVPLGQQTTIISAAADLVTAHERAALAGELGIDAQAAWHAHRGASKDD